MHFIDFFVPLTLPVHILQHLLVPNSGLLWPKYKIGLLLDGVAGEIGLG
jgi:hypothetical protein